MKFSKFNYISFTVTVADPGVFTSVAHELYTDDTIELETTGDLPTGLSVDTTYYVIVNGITADTWQLATTRGGTAIETTGTQSGAHTWIKTNKARIEPFIENNM